MCILEEIRDLISLVPEGSRNLIEIRNKTTNFKLFDHIVNPYKYQNSMIDEVGKLYKKYDKNFDEDKYLSLLMNNNLEL